MTILFSLLAAAALYVVVVSVRWFVTRRQANAAIAALQREVDMAFKCQGELYSQKYGNPALMFQVVEEVRDAIMALQGSMILVPMLTPWKKRLHWKATRGYRDVINRAQLGMRALNDAAFFSQFPPGVKAFRNVCINGIPLCERC